MNKIGKSQQPNILQDSSVVVFGGGGGWGKRIVDAFEKLNYAVKIIETDNTPEEAKKAVENNNIIFLAVPDPQINGILIKTKSFLVKDKVILDCATNKIGFANTLSEIANSGASVCSTHPMIMPEISPRGHNVIFMPLGNKSEFATNVAKMVFSENMGMNSQQFDFDQHADLMVILQMVPHLIQRILIDAIGHGINDKDMTINDLAPLAPANYLLAELGIGRVAVQEPYNSAGIIESALQTKFGKKIFGGIQSNLDQINEAEDREELSNLLTQGVNRLDPDRMWRKQMTDRTEVALTRLGNLRGLSCKIEATNKPGILRDILNILHDKYSIDMTALDSQVIHQDDGSSKVCFDIGINSRIDFKKLATHLNEIDCYLKVP